MSGGKKYLEREVRKTFSEESEAARPLSRMKEKKSLGKKETVPLSGKERNF